MPKLMLCQDCLAIYPATDAGQRGEELCNCGGDLCACPDCASYAAEIQQTHEQRQAQAQLFEDQQTVWINHPVRGWCLSLADNTVATHE